MTGFKIPQSWYKENETRRRNAIRPNFGFTEGPTYAGRRALPAGQSLVVLPGLRTLIQDPNLPRIPGRVGFNHELLAHASSGDGESPDNLPPDDPFASSPLPGPALISLPWAHDSSAGYAKKKARQWARWTREVIPGLVQPHMDYIAGGRVPLPSAPCSCRDPRPKKLSIMAVYLDRTSATIKF